MCYASGMKRLAAAKEAVAEWRYELTDEMTEADLTNVLTTISFRLSDESGRILPAAPFTMVADDAG